MTAELDHERIRSNKKFELVRSALGGRSGENPRGKNEAENMSDLAWLF
jgi:hypothetical protein